MSDYIKAYAHFAGTQDGMTAFCGSNVTYDLTGTVLAQTQNVGTSAELLDLGDVGGGSAPGLIYIRNIDATNYLEIALDSGMTKKFAKIIAGAVAIFCPAASSYYVRADTSAVNIELIACGQVSVSSTISPIRDTTSLSAGNSAYLSASVTGIAGGVAVNGAGSFTGSASSHLIGHTLEPKAASPEQRGINACYMMAVNSGVEDITAGLASGSDAFAILPAGGGFFAMYYAATDKPYFWCSTGDNAFECLYFN